MESPSRDENGRTIKVYAEISNSLSIKTLVEWLNNTNTDGNLVFSKSSITFFKGNSDMTIVNNLCIHTYKLKKYIYNSKEEEILFGFTVKDLKPIIDAIGKKDHIKLKILKKAQKLYIGGVSGEPGENSESNYQELRFQKVKDSRISIEEFNRPINDPVCNIVVSTFCKKCSVFAKLGKHGTYVIRAYPEGIYMKASNPGKLMKHTGKFGMCRNKVTEETEDDEGNMITQEIKIKPKIYEIDHNTIKAFSKLMDLGNKLDTFQVYTEEGKPLRFIFNVGNYATLAIDINSCDS